MATWRPCRSVKSLMGDFRMSKEQETQRKADILRTWVDSQPDERVIDIVEPEYLKAPVEEQRQAKANTPRRDG